MSMCTCVILFSTHVTLSFAHLVLSGMKNGFRSIHRLPHVSCFLQYVEHIVDILLICVLVCICYSLLSEWMFSLSVDYLLY